MILLAYLLLCTLLLAAVVYYETSELGRDVTLWWFLVFVVISFTPGVNIITLGISLNLFGVFDRVIFKAKKKEKP